jgi:hypothetical protein
MPTAIDKIMDSIKKFEAENAAMSANAGDLLDNSLPGVATSHAHCAKNYKESMTALIKLWKAKAAALKAAHDPNPEYHAAQQMQVTFMNVQSTFMQCMRTPLHKLKTPAPGDKF